jgi:AraC family transcriptional regulator
MHGMQAPLPDTAEASPPPSEAVATSQPNLGWNRQRRRGLANWQVRRVTAYMGERLDQEICLEELARLVNLSRFHFCTAFRLATGQTPLEWLIARRIERACTLLAQTSMSITKVGLAVGYATPSAFAASFHKRMGMTPSEFRRTL